MLWLERWHVGDREKRNGDLNRSQYEFALPIDA
jgi:hypothetical protein